MRTLQFLREFVVMDSSVNPSVLFTPCVPDVYTEAYLTRVFCIPDMHVSRKLHVHSNCDSLNFFLWESTTRKKSQGHRCTQCINNSYDWSSRFTVPDNPFNVINDSHNHDNNDCDWPRKELWFICPIGKQNAVCDPKLMSKYLKHPNNYFWLRLG